MASNDLAKTLKALHKPSSPIVFPNVWDVASFNAISSLNSHASTPQVKGIATASFAIAAQLGIKDEELSLEQNLDAIRKIAPLCRQANLPLSVDIQDGYGAQIESVVAAVVEAGAVGANIEDSIPSAGFDKGISGSLYAADEQVQRLKAALEAAAASGCPDFVLNARCDVFRLDETSSGLDDEARMREAVGRGRAYLDAGAATIFFWGGGARGLSRAEVETLVRELGGRVAVKLGDGIPEALSVRELAEIGVARISVGPSLFLRAMDAAKKAASSILSGGRLD